MVGPGRPNPEQLRGWLAPLLRAPDRAVLALDYDGTLAPVVPDPERATPAPGAVQVLVDLSGRLGTLAVVSGRPADVLVRLGGLDRVPGLVVIGLYGEQRWEAGRLTAPAPPPGLAAALLEVPALLLGAGPSAAGAWVETKGGSFTVHLRTAADPAAAMRELRAPLAALAARRALVLQVGRLALELRRAGPDKGNALADLAANAAASPAGGPSAVLYIGDDLGDLPAFATAAALRRAGVPAWSVAAASPEVPEVSAAADVVVDGPGGVVELLRAIADLINAPAAPPTQPADG